MNRGKTIYLFILWTFFGISLSLLWGYYFMDHFTYVDPYTKLDTDNILTSLKSWFKSMPLWTSSEQYKKFDTVWNVLTNQYIDKDKLDFQKWVDNALKWFVDSIWDPYSMYFTTTENKSFQDDLKWEKDFEWIWAVVWKKQDWIMIEEVIKWFPAYNAWLKPLDIIFEIWWEKTKNMTLSEAVSKIRWPSWSEIELVIIRQWEKELLRIKVKRDKILVPSVSAKVLELTWWNNVWYINISIIWEDTEVAFKNSIKELKDKDVKWLIVDLRWNGWGYLPIATELLSHFVPKDQVVVSSKYRIYPDEVYKSKWYWDFEWYKVVILVDGMSASASEIIAAWLRDNIWAKLVWAKTFGKWSIQTIYDLQDGSSLKYTIWKWYTPKWESIDQKWLEPDEKIEFDAELYKNNEFDNQLDKAKQVIFNMIK